MRPAASSAAVVVLLIILVGGTESTFAAFELDESVNTVECLECVQTWPPAAGYSTAPKCSHPRTCRANACFMRQCKHCPVYQYMMGCVQLSRWQMDDLKFAKSRIGATLLCEDTFNQTTCVCNRRDKCNNLHLHLPYTTYTEGLFTGIVNFDAVITDLDPSYGALIHGSGRIFGYASSYTGFQSGSSLLITSAVLLFHVIR